MTQGFIKPFLFQHALRVPWPLDHRLGCGTTAADSPPIVATVPQSICCNAANDLPRVPDPAARASVRLHQGAKVPGLVSPSSIQDQRCRERYSLAPPRNKPKVLERYCQAPSRIIGAGTDNARLHQGSKVQRLRTPRVYAIPCSQMHTGPAEAEQESNRARTLTFNTGRLQEGCPFGAPAPRAAAT